MPKRKAALSRMTEPPTHPQVGIIMGSRSDLPTMRAAAHMLRTLAVPFEMRVVSVHRTPDWAMEYAETAAGRGLQVIIAGSGGAAALPGVIAAKTCLPVLGVPLDATALAGVDALMAVVQMPGGVPVAGLGIGAPGAKNAAILAARILALTDRELQARLVAWSQEQTARVLDGGTRIELDELGET